MDGNGETTISYVKIWNHPIETTIKTWLFRVPVPGTYCISFVRLNAHGSQAMNLLSAELSQTDGVLGLQQPRKKNKTSRR